MVAFTFIDQQWKKGSTDLVRLGYGYNRSSSRVYKEDSVAASNSQNLDETYHYDSLQRLQKFHRGDLSSDKKVITSPVIQQSWQLDATGNWNNFTQNDPSDSSKVLDQTRATNTANEITEIARTVGNNWATPEHDATGNMTTIPQPADMESSYDCVYDAWNRLVKVEENSVVVSQHFYNGINYRIKNYFPGMSNSYQYLFYNTSAQCVETRENTTNSVPSSATYQYVWSSRYIDSPVLRESSSATLYFLHDANFNVTAVTDDAGAVQERYAYEPDGKTTIFSSDFSTEKTTSSINNRFTFTGRKVDPESGLMYFRNRYYDSNLGRFVNRDPIGYRGGINLLRGYFVPNGVDPSGLQSNNLLDSFCSGVESCNKCSKADCLASVKKLKEAKGIADEFIDGAEWEDVEDFGGYCHAWVGQFEGCKCMNPPPTFKNATACLSYPKNYKIELEDSMLPWHGDGKIRTWWSDHRISVVKNSCTGKCLAFDDGFWGSSNADLRSGVYDPCTIGRPAMVTGRGGVMQWNKILNRCGCPNKAFTVPPLPAPSKDPYEDMPIGGGWQ